MKNKKVFIVLSIFIIIIGIFFISFTLSKYKLEEKESHIQEATAFYFESDVAKVEEQGTETNTYNIDDWDGDETQIIKFNVKNYINNLLKTENDIYYNISTIVSNNDDNAINVNIKNSSNETITSQTQCVIEASAGFQCEEYILEITTNNQIENGRTFEIELNINSTSPYAKNLKAIILLTVKSENYIASLVNSNNGEYVTLNIKVNNPSKDAVITYDNNKLILDTANNILDGAIITTNSITISKEKLQKGENYNIHFVKLEDDIVLGTDITVE